MIVKYKNAAVGKMERNVRKSVNVVFVRRKLLKQKNGQKTKNNSKENQREVIY